MWFSTIVRVAWLVTTGRGAEDMRSDEEEYVLLYSLQNFRCSTCDITATMVTRRKRKTSDCLNYNDTLSTLLLNLFEQSSTWWSCDVWLRLFWRIWIALRGSSTFVPAQIRLWMDLLSDTVNDCKSLWHHCSHRRKVQYFSTFSGKLVHGTLNESVAHNQSRHCAP